MKKRRKFDRAFKDMVVQLSYNRDDITALAVDMSLRPKLIYRWRTEAREGGVKLGF
jgi:transposase